MVLHEHWIVLPLSVISCLINPEGHKYLLFFKRLFFFLDFNINFVILFPMNLYLFLVEFLNIGHTKGTGLYFKSMANILKTV